MINFTFRIALPKVKSVQMVRLSMVLLVMIIASASFLVKQEWTVDRDFLIRFSSDNPSGSFQKMTGQINFDPENLMQAHFEFIIDPSSIQTGNLLKNAHAKGYDWLDVQNYPRIIFRSERVTATENGFLAEGTLRIKSTARKIFVPFVFKNNHFVGTFKLDRLAYQVGGMHGISAEASRYLTIDFDIPVHQ